MKKPNMQIYAIAENYIKDLINQDSDWFNHISDRWIYDACEWYGITYQVPENDERFNIFRDYAMNIKEKLYMEKYAVQDCKQFINNLVGDLTNASSVLHSYFPYIMNKYPVPETCDKVFGDIEILKKSLNSLKKLL